MLPGRRGDREGGGLQHGRNVRRRWRVASQIRLLIMKPVLHHVAITVNNINESLRWYEDKLGCAFIKRYDDAKMHMALMSFGKFYIELFQLDNSKPLPKYRKELMSDLTVVGTKHICLGVDDIDKTMNMLGTKGVEFTTEPDTSFYGSRYVFFKDCNGILIELSESSRVL